MDARNELEMLGGGVLGAITAAMAMWAWIKFVNRPIVEVITIDFRWMTEHGWEPIWAEQMEKEKADAT